MKPKTDPAIVRASEWMPPNDPRHGTVAGYNRIPCREECCRRAMAIYRKKWNLDKMYGRDRLIPILGARRRLQALAALGWSNAEVARRMGMNSEHLPHLLRYATHIGQRNAARIAAVYDELSMQLPKPTTRHQKQAMSVARNRARRNGWPPPLAWNNIDDPDERPHERREDRRTKTDVDHAVVERVLAGDRLPMTTAERREVVTRARAKGWSLLQIEERTGISKPERIVAEMAEAS